MLETNFILNDPQSGEPRVETVGRFARGNSSDLLTGRTLVPPLVRCVVKVPAPDGDSADEIRRRLDRVETEYDAMQAVSPWVAMPVGLFEHQVQLPDGTSLKLPIIARRHFDGETLRERIARSPRGLPLADALQIAARIAAGLHAIHELGFVMRSLSPQHVLVDGNNEVCIIGFGNAWRRQERIDPEHVYFDELYSAPELAGEVSGRFILPKADLFSFGALLAFLVTGEDPTGRVDSPLTRAAHERLAELPEGVALIVAHCMQPIGKKRFGSIAKLEPLLRADALPTARDPDFAAIALIAPTGRRGVDYARVGHLTAGPLVNRTADDSAEPTAPLNAPAAETDDAQGPPRIARLGAAALGAFALLVLVAFVVATIRGG